MSERKQGATQPHYYDGKWSIMTTDADGNPQRVFVDGPDAPKLGEIYLHHSGTLYEIKYPVHCANTGEQMVSYREIKSFSEVFPVGKTWVHTVENFMQPGRFKRVR